MSKEDKEMRILLEYIKQASREYFRNKALGKTPDNDVPSIPGGDINVTHQEKFDKLTKQVTQNIYFQNLQPEDMETIRQKMNRNPEVFTKAVSIPKGRDIRENILAITINDEDVNDWMNNGGLSTLLKILKDSGNYSDETIENLPGVISNRLTSKSERNELFKNAAQSAIDIWLGYLETINDPKTEELLKTYSRVLSDSDEKAYGHMLSVKNVAMIRAIDSNATFVLPESKWVQFNRYVIPRAKKFIVYTPNAQNNKLTKNKLQKVIDKCGWKGVPYYRLPLQTQIEVDIKCNELGLCSFRPVIEFDISDTKVMPGKPDLFNQEVGLANNLTGELNAAAIEQMGDKAKENMPQDEIMDKRTELAANFMKQFCQEKGVNVSLKENETPDNVLIECLYQYYLSRAEKDANIDKDTNKDIFAKNATHFTLIFAKLAWNKLGTFSHPAQYTKKEGAEFLNLVHGVLRNLEPAIALNENESVGNDKQNLLSSFKQYCKKYNIQII